MKRNILIYVVLSLVTCALSAQVVTGKKVMWDYPVKPDMEEWKKYNSPEEIYQALNKYAISVYQQVKSYCNE